MKRQRGLSKNVSLWKQGLPHDPPYPNQKLLALKALGISQLQIRDCGLGYHLNNLKVRQRQIQGMSESCRSQPSFPSEKEAEDHPGKTYLSKFTAN